MKTFHTLGYRPPIVIGDDAGFSDPSFAKTVGNLAQGALDRSAFVPGKPDSLTYKVNALFKQKTGRDLDDTTARSMEGFFVLCDAINRAGSTKPEAIREALVATDLPASELMIGYKGVKFDKTGQNTLAYSLMIQLQGPGTCRSGRSRRRPRSLRFPSRDGPDTPARRRAGPRGGRMRTMTSGG